MSTQMQLRRGTGAEVAAFTPAEGEVVMDTTALELRLGDGSTAGGLAIGASEAFPAGTLLMFQQTAAPTGWTKQTTHDDKALRVTSGAAGSGGNTPFNTVFGALKTTGSASPGFTNHTHTQRGDSTPDPSGSGGAQGDDSNASNLGPTQGAGSGSSHDHTLSLDLQFVDLIIASKD